MRAVFTSLGSASAFILLTSLLVSGAYYDDFFYEVTTQQCRDQGKVGKLRTYPEDMDATVLAIQDCNIGNINEDDITGLPNVTVIFLHYNNMTHVDLSVFRHVPILKHVRLDHNKLRELSAFAEHSCRFLAELNLHNNQLTTLDNAQTFSACTQLKTLTLSNNQITEIHPDIFSALTELETLYFANNKLSFIPSQMFVNNTMLRRLYLHKNRLTYIPQDFASSFRRAGYGLISFTFYDNPWPCACLQELLADVRRSYVRDFSEATFDGKQPQCVDSGAVPCRPPSSNGLLPPPRAVGTVPTPLL